MCISAIVIWMQHHGVCSVSKAIGRPPWFPTTDRVLTHSSAHMSERAEAGFEPLLSCCAFLCGLDTYKGAPGLRTRMD